MFEILSERLQGIFQRLDRRGRLDEKAVDEALREVRLALLEADVNFRVARDFIAGVREQALRAEVLDTLTPAQQVLRVVHKELTALLGGGQEKLRLAATPPTVVLLVGLQGSGKTTTAAKLGLHLRRSGQRPLLVAADGRRPAAVEQLQALGRQLDIPVYSMAGEENAVVIGRGAVKQARELGITVSILDTGGRWQIDGALMEEVEAVKGALNPAEVLLVLDAMMGQEAVRVAEEFHRRLGLTGLVLTKLDGDARGGAALSIRAVTGLPIKFVGTGEKADALEPFYPDRMASRILGMGDIATLIERAEAVVDEKKARELEKKLRRATFDLEDFLEQLRQLNQMGPLEQILEMIPGLSRLSRRMPPAAIDQGQMKTIEAIILSMTRQERRRPEIIDGSRRRRIARGSGTTPQAVNQVLKQYKEMQRLAKALGAGRGPRFR